MYSLQSKTGFNFADQLSEKGWDPLDLNVTIFVYIIMRPEFGKSLSNISVSLLSRHVQMGLNNFFANFCSFIHCHEEMAVFNTIC